MPSLSPSAASIPGSGIREIVNLVLDRPAGEVARLEIGEPDSLTPSHVVEAAALAMRGRVGYTQSAGITSLREALVDRLDTAYGMSLALPNVLVTQGAVQGIAAALAAVLRPGDEVLIPDPAWPNYDMQALLLGAKPVHYGLRSAARFLPDPAEIEALITPATRAIVLNSPSNPTGAVIGAVLMERIVHIAAERDILVISDEVYDEIIFDGVHVGARQFAPEHVVSVFSFSKTYSMTGWRVGYAVVPDTLALGFERIQETLLSCVSSVSQAAALAAITGQQTAVAENLERYRSRRDLAVKLLAAENIAAAVPGGAFYLMVPLAESADSRLAALELVTRGVSVAPGAAFGDEARTFLRLNLASPESTLTTGIERLLDWYSATEGGSHALEAVESHT